ncbi:hypothetical protein HMPREF1979_02064 [Actinomyces johnsonii F0542]|uniref:Uncharacterized protein n=1 Tax=Actinomyces johnsonii F0542 TaxID=1321818 RepID=U1QLC4_9ACTO|nr:hypothetical protein HMPREF1979_02064 [Actinomyces johnsonii F0542]
MQNASDGASRHVSRLATIQSHLGRPWSTAPGQHSPALGRCDTGGSDEE